MVVWQVGKGAWGGEKVQHVAGGARGKGAARGKASGKRWEGRSLPTCNGMDGRGGGAKRQPAPLPRHCHQTMSGIE